MRIKIRHSILYNHKKITSPIQISNKRKYLPTNKCKRKNILCTPKNKPTWYEYKSEHRHIIQKTDDNKQSIKLISTKVCVSNIKQILITRYTIKIQYATKRNKKDAIKIKIPQNHQHEIMQYK
jgi:hypothetical protein